jgi:hypothetical protein
MKILSTLRGLLKNNLNGQKIFHKNLFLDGFDGIDEYIEDYDNDSDEEFNEENQACSYEEDYETNSKMYELRHLPVPLTGKNTKLLILTC